jgi:outer membrane protein assembly factor BamB
MPKKNWLIGIALIIIIFLLLRKAKKDSEQKRDTIWSDIWNTLFPPETTTIMPGQTGTEVGGGGTVVTSPADFAALADAIRLLAEGTRIPDLGHAQTVLSASGSVELVPAASSQRIYVNAYAITTSADCTVQFLNGQNGTVLWQIHLQPAATTRSGANLCSGWPVPIFVTDSGKALWVSASAACEVAVSYWRQ